MILMRVSQTVIVTIHMLDLNRPKHSYVFLRKRLEAERYQISAISAWEVLKRNTDSLRNAIENDVFALLPQDSLLDEMEMDWPLQDVSIGLKSKK